MGTPEAEHRTDADGSTAEADGMTERSWIAWAGRVIEGLFAKRRSHSVARGHNTASASEPGPHDAEDNGRSWVPFDEQRHCSDLRRADIVFGPDMFDPRTDNGDQPLTRAMLEGRSDVDPADLSKTVGEVFGDISPAELRRIMLENAQSIDLQESPASDHRDSAA